MSIDSKFVELTADVLDFFFNKIDHRNHPRPIQQFWAPTVMGNEWKMRTFGGAGGASRGPPSRAGGGLLSEG